MAQRLQRFLEANPESALEEVTYPIQGFAITEPWGDRSIEIFLPARPDPLISALNNVFLPERFTAIWHTDSKLFEIIYTVYEVEKEIANRSFSIEHKGRTYECFFRDASERLLLFAEHYYAVGTTTTDYRNLDPFSDYVLGKKRVRGFKPIPSARPLCFWIKGIPDWNTDLVLDLARHLNFYMAYYDTDSPQILIHATPAEEIAMQPDTRFREGKFPPQIQLRRPIEENLLIFWQAAREGDPIQAFLNYFLILEYASFFYVKEDVKRAVKRHLSAPHATANIDALTEQMLVDLSQDQLEPHQKMDGLLSRCVEPVLVWREMSKNRDYFSTAQTFEGGFSVEPTLSKDATEKTFSSNFVTTFGAKIRSIRNAIAHGKEQRSLTSIVPTTSNFSKLEPWVSAIAVAAREVMIYRVLD
jgi:hypothetical protein